MLDVRSEKDLTNCVTKTYKKIIIKHESLASFDHVTPCIHDSISTCHCLKVSLLECTFLHEPTADFTRTHTVCKHESQSRCLLQIYSRESAPPRSHSAPLVGTRSHQRSCGYGHAPCEPCALSRTMCSMSNHTHQRRVSNNRSKGGAPAMCGAHSPIPASMLQRAQCM